MSRVPGSKDPSGSFRASAPSAPRHARVARKPRASGHPAIAVGRCLGAGFMPPPSSLSITTSSFRSRHHRIVIGCRLQTSDFRLQTSDFRLQTSDFRLQQESAFSITYAGPSRPLSLLSLSPALHLFTLERNVVLVPVSAVCHTSKYRLFALSN